MMKILAWGAVRGAMTRDGPVWTVMGGGRFSLGLEVGCTSNPGSAGR